MAYHASVFKASPLSVGRLCAAGPLMLDAVRRSPPRRYSSGDDEWCVACTAGDDGVSPRASMHKLFTSDPAAFPEEVIYAAAYR
jgi:hypothetical protein